MTLKKQLEPFLSEAFQNIYYCERVWSAWSYNTMSIEDFSPIFEDEDIFNEIVESIIELNILNLDNLISILENYNEFYYNEDLETQFNSNSFSDDWLDSIDLTTLIENIQPIFNLIKLNANIKEF